MQLELSIHAIEARSAALGLPLTRLAAKAGVAASTLYRLKNDVSPHLRTLKAVNAVLCREEQRLLAHLIALYPGGILPTPGLPAPSSVPTDGGAASLLSREAAA